MAARMPRTTASEALRKLRRDGWVIARQRGTSHAILTHPTKPGRVTVPVHVGQSLGPKIMGAILHQAGLTSEEFRKL